MRGWDGKSAYPIKSSHKDDPNLIDERTYDQLELFEYQLKEQITIGPMISNLPLFKYHYGQFTILNYKCHILTIGEQLIIVKEGNLHNDDSSCIRVTSNWILATVYRYYQILHLSPLFDIKQMAIIS